MGMASINPKSAHRISFSLEGGAYSKKGAFFRFYTEFEGKSEG